MNKEEIKKQLFEMIIDSASLHPHRDWNIGLDGTMEEKRKENLAHWESLADNLADYFMILLKGTIELEIK